MSLLYRYFRPLISINRVCFKIWFRYAQSFFIYRCFDSCQQIQRVTWPTVENPWIKEDIEKRTLDFEKPEKPVNYEVSTEDFKFVERLLPVRRVPPPPARTSCPTPSGWVPPAGECTSIFSVGFRGTKFPGLQIDQNSLSQTLVMRNKKPGKIFKILRSKF